MFVQKLPKKNIDALTAIASSRQLKTSNWKNFVNMEDWENS